MKLTEGGRLERPNACTICERTPEIGEEVIDTERYFDGWPASLHGRRYICKKCATEAAKLVSGLISQREYDFIVGELKAARLEIINHKALLGTIQEALLGNFKVVTPAESGGSVEASTDEAAGDSPSESGDSAVESDSHSAEGRYQSVAQS